LPWIFSFRNWFYLSGLLFFPGTFFTACLSVGLVALSKDLLQYQASSGFFPGAVSEETFVWAKPDNERIANRKYYGYLFSFRVYFSLQRLISLVKNKWIDQANGIFEKVKMNSVPTSGVRVPILISWKLAMVLNNGNQGQNSHHRSGLNRLKRFENMRKLIRHNPNPYLLWKQNMFIFLKPAIIILSVLFVVLDRVWDKVEQHRIMSDLL